MGLHMLSIERVKNDYVVFLKNVKFHQAVMVLLGATFIALTAQLTIPLSPVPITLQPFAVLLISAFLGADLGSKAVLLYLFAGMFGLPVFAGFSFGLAVILGPTGGYLIGFIGTAYLTGYLLQHGWGKSSLQIFLAALFGEIVLFITGYLVLAFFIGYRDAYLFGVAPFYLVELARLLLFALVAAPFLRKNKIG